MKKIILNWTYDVFQLEGVPAYTSHFIPVNFKIQQWMDINDLSFFRKEKLFIPMNDPGKKGVEYCFVGYGNGNQKRTEYWDGEVFHTESSLAKTPPISFDEWKSNIKKTGEKFGNEYVNQKKLTRLDNEFDEKFQELIVVEGSKILMASDQFYEKPMQIVYKLDSLMKRKIEEIHYLYNESQKIIHSQTRLSYWEIVEIENGIKLFDPEVVLGFENT